MNEEYVSIFMETTEDMGMMFDSYKSVLGHINKFMDTIDSCIKKLNSGSDESFDMGDEIKKFKSNINIERKPAPISTGRIKEQIKKVKDFRADTDKSLDRYSKMKNDISYGGTPLTALLGKRPKVYSKEIDAEKYDKVNSNIRNLNRAMDWVEKCFIDLYAYISQDLDLLNIVDKVYVKQHIFESVPGIVEEDVADSVVPMLPQATAESAGDKAISNTTDKKTGQAPPYIANNHDMAKYGEDDKPQEDPNKEVTLDDYKRPSADVKPESDGEPAPYSGDTNDSTDVNPFEDKKDEPVKQSTQNGVNNYYYYTYNNSLNRHHRDDHSVNTKTDDHSDNRTYVNGYKDHDPRKKDEGSEEFHKVESAPWELNDLTESTPIMESPSYYPNPITSNGKEELNLAIKKFGKGLFGKKLSPELLEVPQKVQLNILDSNRDGTYSDDQIIEEFEVVPGLVYGDDGNTPYHSFDEVTLGVCLLNSVLGIDNGLKFLTCFEQINNSLYEYIRSACKDQGLEFEEGKLVSNYRKFNFKSKKIFIKKNMNIGFMFESDLDPEHGVGINFGQSNITHGDDSVAFESTRLEATIQALGEDVANPDDMKPTSDHPVKDALLDVDRKTTKIQQDAKRGVQNVANVGRAAVKPVNRTKQWVGNMVSNWKDKNETQIKEDLADPHARNNLFNAVKKAIEIGALYQAGLLLNPWFIALGAAVKIGKKKKQFRMRNEMIGELKTELEVIDEKIKDADRNGDNKAKYQLMRFKNEINKKLLRVGGDPSWKKIL